MNCMSDEMFFDTNVLVYACDAGAPAKRKKASSLLAEHAMAGEVVISTQVLQEFYVTVTRKLSQPLEQDTAFGATRELTTFLHREYRYKARTRCYPNIAKAPSFVLGRPDHRCCTSGGRHGPLQRGSQRRPAL